MTRHLTTLDLSTLAVAALGPEERSAVEGHLAACGRCQALAQEMQVERARFDASVFPRTAAQLRARAGGRLRQWLAELVPARALATAAGLAAVAVAGALALRPAPPRFTIKGGAVLQVYARRGGDVFAVRPETPVVAGDQLRFAVEPGGAGYVLIASLDGAGRATIYYPFGGAQSAAVASRGRSELPGSITLDSTPGDERLYVLFSAAPVAAAAVLDRIRGRPPSLDLPGVTELTADLHKAGP